MSHTVVGHCPRCGAPIYSPMVWHGIVPPPSSYTCACFSMSGTFYGTSTNVSANGPATATADDTLRLFQLVDAQDARIQQLERILDDLRKRPRTSP